MKTRRRNWKLNACAVLAFLPIASPMRIQGQAPETSELHILPLRGNVYLLHGAGANITLSVGKEGVLMVDTGSAAMSDKVLSAVKDLTRQVAASPAPVRPCFGAGCGGADYSYLATIASPAPPPPIRFIVNTNADPDHTGGNARIAKAGKTFGAGPGVGQFLAIVKSSAAIYAHLNVLARMAAAKAPGDALPSEGFEDNFKQFINGEGVQIIHLKAAHTDGDAIVHFRGSDVVSTGDVLSTTTFPVVDIARGGSIDGLIGALNQLLDLAIPEYQSEGGTLFVPGHGRVCDIADLASYRDSVTIMRDRISDMIARGMALEQVKAARPTRDYDTRYNTTELPRDAFVESVYKSLTAGKK